jgi:hypothetical protein
VFEVCLLIFGLVLVARVTGMVVDIFDYEVNAVGSKVVEGVVRGAVKLEEIEARLVTATVGKQQRGAKGHGQAAGDSTAPQPQSVGGGNTGHQTQGGQGHQNQHGPFGVAILVSEPV